MLFSHLIDSASLYGENKSEGGHCATGVSSKFTACIACPSGLACDVTLEPEAEEVETNMKRNRNTIKNRAIYETLSHPKEDPERLLLLLLKHK